MRGSCIRPKRPQSKLYFRIPPDRPMRKAAASLFLSFDVAAQQPDEFVTVVCDATEEDLRSTSR